MQNSLDTDPLNGLQRRRAPSATKRRALARAQLAAIVESSEDAIYCYDFNARILNWNKGAEKIYGWTAAEIIGQPVTLILPPERAAEPQEKIIPAIERGQAIANFETVRVRRDGSRFDALMTASPIKDAAGRIIAVSVITRDITTFLQAQKRLRESEEKLSLFIEYAPAAVAMLDREMRYLAVSRRWMQDFGLKGEIVGRSHYEVFPEIPEHWKAIYRRCLAGAIEKSDEDCLARADGSIEWVKWEAHPWFKENGEIGGIVIFSENISERKRAEQQIAGQNRTLEALAMGRELSEILDLTTQTIEAMLPASRASVMLADADGKRLFCGAAKSLPAAYNRAIEGMAIAEGVGSCGTAAFRRAPVIVADIARDALWKEFRNLAEAHNLRACWSQPICAPDGKLLGTFAVYFPTPRAPKNEELKILESAARVAGIAIYRKQTEEALQKSEAEFRTLARAVPQIVWVADAQGKITYVNEQWTEFSGLTREETDAPAIVAQIIHPDDRARVFKVWTKAFDTGAPFQVEARLRDQRTGEYRWFLLRSVPFKDGDGRAQKWFGTSTDITEGKAAEAKLLEAERHASREYQKLLSRIAPLAETLSAARDLNAIYRAILEFCRASMPCVNFFISFYDAPKDERTLAFAWRETEGEVAVSTLPSVSLTGAKGPSTSAVHECRTIIVDTCQELTTANPRADDGASDDRHRSASSVAAPMVVRNHIIGTLEVHASQAKAFQREHVVALEMAANLAAVAIENVRLLDVERAARREAERANRMKDEFLSTLSHELRTPLTAILGWTKMLRGGMLNDANAARALEIVERSAQAQQRLVEDILDVSRIITGKLKLNMRDVELAKIVGDAVETIRPAAEAKQIALNTRFETESVSLLGDAARLQQIVWNLLVNAIKFTPSGGRIDVSVERRDEQVEIVIADTGQGISAEFLPHVFERFRQADGSTTRAHGGLGLGLAIVRYLTELHGGTVRAKSKGEGCGATFIVSLPIKAKSIEEDSDDAHEIKPATLVTTNGARRLEDVRVLIVEDDADARELLSVALVREGARVTGVASVEEALAAYDRAAFDAMISDIGMPNRDGYELMREIRRREREQADRRTLPAVALTAYARPEDNQNALAAGYNLHLAKPIEPLNLIDIVSKLLESER
jgi:PAS domain S-box-containing protein